MRYRKKSEEMGTKNEGSTIVFLKYLKYFHVLSGQGVQFTQRFLTKFSTDGTVEWM